MGVGGYAYVAWRPGRDDHVDGWSHLSDVGWWPTEAVRDVERILRETTQRKSISPSDFEHPEFTFEEKRVVDRVAEVEGQTWAEEHAELLLDRARHAGEP